MELKIKCQCGVKYALDVTAQTVANPIQFLCQYCGVDSSAAVNEIIRQQFRASVLPPTERLPTVPVAAAVASMITSTAPQSARAEARPSSTVVPTAAPSVPGPPRPASAKLK